MSLQLAERGLRLGMVVDLTDTDRYYDKAEIEGMCIQYRKINCPGRGFVDRTECVAEFNKAIQDYIDRSDDEEALIGVHCTNGVNRSGYLICRFLIERLGWSSHEALDAFERARGYPIEKGSYVQALHKAAIESRNRRLVMLYNFLCVNQRYCTLRVSVLLLTLLNVTYSRRAFFTRCYIRR
ncbi:unnamed protein product [Nippostrongylus brasiliensis]|uniref:Probable tyrosine-protein phosphatase (inferred by orthology to a C. elegans protein) n=1 Tax=Nippostrongylus brasiliensis TaxID=27835 RepID=A0A0N4XQ02_NIPBR|nr:unnamed protein product [Nippostrongylus brasiliensis]